MFCVSVKTIHRRLQENGMSIRDSYAKLTEQELDDIVTNILHEIPNSGYKSMRGHLLCRGYKVQEDRIREAMRRTDPEGTVARAQGHVSRTQGHVSRVQGHVSRAQGHVSRVQGHVSRAQGHSHTHRDMSHAHRGMSRAYRGMSQLEGYSLPSSIRCKTTTPLHLLAVVVYTNPVVLRLLGQVLKEQNVQCSVVGLAAEVRVCKTLCSETQGM